MVDIMVSVGCDSDIPSLSVRTSRPAEQAKPPTFFVSVVITILTPPVSFSP